MLLLLYLKTGRTAVKFYIFFIFSTKTHILFSVINQKIVPSSPLLYYYIVLVHFGRKINFQKLLCILMIVFFAFVHFTYKPFSPCLSLFSLSFLLHFSRFFKSVFLQFCSISSPNFSQLLAFALFTANFTGLFKNYNFLQKKFALGLLFLILFINCTCLGKK